MLYLILIAFLIGFLLGMKGKLKFLKKWNVITISTVLLLFFMGFELGSDKNLIKQLSEIGYLSFLIALFAIIGSALLPTIYEKIFLNKGDKK
ncbi:LysO family transporter [Marinitoga aeolica]|uniref:LysO family transporter n=1 Tax=Marinitoga aeolica TaxID=2809031 RepID=A0ABY8PR64_9BACT|nr:LysO family transporter [Marinitoga aeolica]WGS65118.1 LysO family transporter [Marinitoga aeolica]